MRSAAACHICSASVRNSTPQPIDTAMNTAMPSWMMRRGSWRSARPPDQRAKSRNGTQCEMTAKPASAGEWNFCHIIQ